MLIAAGRDHVLFDGDCGVCSVAADALRAVDRARRFVVEPYQTFPEAELNRIGLTTEACARALQFLSRDGRVHSGAFAVNAVLWRLPGGAVLIALVYALPILLLLEIVAYRLIASRRHQISRWLGMKACLVKPS